MVSSPKSNGYWFGPKGKVFVDVPSYCPSCGKQYYVSGGTLRIGNRTVRAFEIETERGETLAQRGNPYCPECLDVLVPLEELESLVGEELRSF